MRRTRRRSGMWPGAALIGLAAALTVAGPAHGQRADSATVVAGPHYRAGPLGEALFGRGYRHLWTAPLRVEVLDLGRTAGGLSPLRPGGGNQTRTLHMEGADGRRYIFRSVDKNVAQVLPPDLERTPIHRLFQDHISANLPTGALALPPLLEAVGVLHVTPRLFVMPDDARLGEHRAEFAGMLGMLEERPDEGEDGDGGFAGSTRVVSTERLLERLVEDPAQHVASAEYLTARLVDFLVGDTDRGSDQWRWAGVPTDDGLRFRPVPRDRDWAFIRSDGWLSDIARILFPKLVRFGPSYPSIAGLTMASIHRDRQYLADLSRATWDSVTQAVQAALTDDVLAAAVRALPPEHRALEAARLRSALRARRDALGEVSSRFYDRIAAEVDVHGSDEADVAVVDVLRDGRVDVQLGGADAERPRFRRRFDPRETREVRIHLLDGDDRAVVRGGDTPIAIRVIGGPGDDVLADSTRGAGRISFHDAEGDNVFVTRARTRVDRRAFVVDSEDDDDWIAEKITRARFRDWGRGRSVRPTLDHRHGAGVVLGVRVASTRYGFRRVPYARRTWIELNAAPEVGRYGGYGGEIGGHWTRENSPWSTSVVLGGETFDAVRFHGYGNDSPRFLDPGHALAMQRRVALDATLLHGASSRRRFGFGLRGQYYDPRPVPGSRLDALSPRGTASFGSAGVFAHADIVALDRSDNPRRGWALHSDGAFHPLVADLPGAFGTMAVEARTYLTAGPTLALRAGAKRAWGDYPVQQAATIGGRNSLRGYRYSRFSGDAAAYGSAELRLPLAHVPLLLVRGNLGLFAFGDAGRVYIGSASPGGWHTGVGGGVSFTTLGRTFRVSAARGEETRYYLELGGGW